MSGNRTRLLRSTTRWPRKRAQQWYFVVYAANGTAIAKSSEMYTNRGDALKAARSMNFPIVEDPAV